MTDMRDEFDGNDVELNLDTTPAAEEAEGELALDLGAGEEGDDVALNLDFGGDDVDEADADLPGLELPGLDLGEEADEAEPEEDPEQSADAEAALEELRADLRAKEGDWYVVHTYSGMENRVKQNLEQRAANPGLKGGDNVFECVVPTEQVDELRGNQKKTVTRSILPGYVLVRMWMDNDAWNLVRQTPAVTGFVGNSQDPVPISIEDVEKLLAPAVIAKATQAATGRPAKRKIEVADYKVGDSVQVDDGAFAGVHATITEINPHNQRVKVLVEILGRETPIDLTFAQIKKL